MSPTSMDGRAERRTAVAVVVQLSCEQQAPFAEAVLPSEVALTENVSPHGARILCRHHWQANEPVLVTSAPSDLAAHARVVYCQPLRSGEYALGLHLVETNGTFSLDRQPATDVLTPTRSLPSGDVTLHGKGGVGLILVIS